MEKKDRPPYVRFERRAVEDRSVEVKKGVYGYKDIDIAKITVVGQKDTVERNVEDWLADVAKRAGEGLLPPEWVQGFERAYDFWKKGQEVPLDGTPIKNWSLISPAQQQTLIGAGIFTVEDLAGISGEGQNRIGTGAVSLKIKAEAWLKEANSVGSVAAENATLKRDLEAAQEVIANQSSMLAKMDARLTALEPKIAPATF